MMLDLEFFLHDGKDIKGRLCRTHSSILNTLEFVGIEQEAEQNGAFQEDEAEENTTIVVASCSNCWQARNYRKAVLAIGVSDLQLLKQCLVFLSKASTFFLPKSFLGASPLQSDSVEYLVSYLESANQVSKIAISLAPISRLQA